MPKQYPITEFDMLTLPDYLQIIKAIIPFMEYGMQRRVSMFIRANELKHTINFYQSPVNCNSFKTCSNSSGISYNTSLTDMLSNDAIINAVMTYCPENIEKMITTFRNFSKMSDIFGKMDLSGFPDMSGTPDSPPKQSGDMNYEALSKILNSSQQDMFNEYIKQLDSLDLSSEKNHK